MVAAHLNHETVYTVLGEAARRRGSRSLAAQLILSLVTGASILVMAPHWWSIACLAGWSAAYSVYGLLVRLAGARERLGRSFNALLVAVAALGTAFALAGVIGIGFAFYTGDAAGAKTTCGKRSTNARCEAWANPPVTTGPVIR